MKIHNLKCDADPFCAMWNGDKTCEIRINDRDYNVADILMLRELSAHNVFTGRLIRAQVTHIQTGYGLPLNVVVMSLHVKYRTEEKPNENV